MERKASLTRTTKETDIKLELNIDGAGETKINTGIGFFDHMLTGFGKHGFFDLNVSVKGDLEVDGHHTVEDTGIVLGNAIKEAIGDKFKKLTSEDIKYFTFLCIEKSGVGVDIYEFSAAIATAIYIDNVITLDKLENVPSDYIIECYEDERIYRIGDYEEEIENEHDDI